MKTKKALLPVLASALLLTMGLAACNNSTPVNPGSSSGEAEEVKIEITSEGDKKEIQVGETLQLSASVDGVAWSTRNTDIVTVSETGLVTAIKDGSARITAKKEGYANGTFTVTVLKAPEREAKYSLRLEDADHYSPNDIWGMDLSAYGMGFMGPGDSPVEDNGGATDDSTSLGWLQAGCKETLSFTSDKAVKVEMGVTMAYNAEMDLSSAITVKFNGKEISMAGRSTVAPESTDNYYEFHAISFGEVDLIAGTNVLEIEMIGQGPNMDKVVFFTNETLQLATIPAQAKPKIEVVADKLEVEVDSEAQIQVKDNLAGVAYKSADETVATVSDAGVVKGIKAGKTTVEVTKEGYKKASVEITVKAKPVAGQIILEAEDAILPEGSTIQMENDNGASGTKSLGYFSAGQTFELKYTAAEAKTYKLSAVVSSASLKEDWSGFAEFALSDEVMTLKLNDAPISLGTHTLPESQGWTKNWAEIELGDVSLVQGENTFAFAAITQGPNIDCLKLTDPNATVNPVEDKVTVTFDANGGTGEMAAVKADKGEFTLPANGFTAPADKEFGGWEITVMVSWGQWTFPQTQVKQPGEKIELTEDITIKANWKAIIEKTAPVDLTNAFYLEAEDGTLGGQAQVETNNTTAHGTGSVGYMSQGASITLKFDASAAGNVRLVLIGSSASANWQAQPVEYYDQGLADTTSIKVNDTEVSLARKGFLGSDGSTMTQVDLGEVAVKAGVNEIVVTALAQSANFDCFAILGGSITVSAHTEA